MAIPKFYEIYRDVLQILSEHQEIPSKELNHLVASSLNLTKDELAELNPGGGNRVRSRVHWAVAYLVQAGAIERHIRGSVRLTGFGGDLLKGPSENLTKEALDMSPGIRAWSKRSKEKQLVKQSNLKTGEIQNLEESDEDSEYSEDGFDDAGSSTRTNEGIVLKPPVIRPSLKAIYTVTPQSVETILSWVKSKEIAIPEIQRPFVWERTDVRDLLDSLYSGFPVGYLITWKNPTVRLKSGGLSSGRKILIDGQQRVTALMTSLLGEKVLNNDYEDLRMMVSFNPLTEELEVANVALKNDPLWIYDIADIFNSTNSTYTIVKAYCEKNKCDEEQEKQVAGAFGRLEKLNITK